MRSPLKFFVPIVMLAVISYIFLPAFRGKGWQDDAGPGFAVVELFTSEGCSSCPPADELAKRMENEVLDKPIYILAFHVDYWNRLGWTDPFSSAVYSTRQNNYAQWLNLTSIYTPQIIVNGQTQFVGSQESSLRSAIHEGLGKAPAGQLQLSAAKVSGGFASVQWQLKGDASDASLVLALVEKNAESKVLAGENRGRTLSHVQIVRTLQMISLDRKQSGTASLAFPASLTPAGTEIIGFVQQKSDGAIKAAAKTGL